MQKRCTIYKIFRKNNILTRRDGLGGRLQIYQLQGWKPWAITASLVPVDIFVDLFVGPLNRYQVQFTAMFSSIFCHLLVATLIVCFVYSQTKIWIEERDIVEINNRYALNLKESEKKHQLPIRTVLLSFIFSLVLSIRERKQLPHFQITSSSTSFACLKISKAF